MDTGRLIGKVDPCRVRICMMKKMPILSAPRQECIRTEYPHEFRVRVPRIERVFVDVLLVIRLEEGYIGIEKGGIAEDMIVINTSQEALLIVMVISVGVQSKCVIVHPIIPVLVESLERKAPCAPELD